MSGEGSEEPAGSNTFPISGSVLQAGSNVCDACCMFHSQLGRVTSNHPGNNSGSVKPPSLEVSGRKQLTKGVSFCAEMATTQRECHKERIDPAAEEFDKPHKGRTHAIIVGHQQNCGLPHPGDNQAGRTQLLCSSKGECLWNC